MERNVQEKFYKCLEGMNVNSESVPANIKARTCRSEIRSVTTAANLLCVNIAMAHNVKYRHTVEYYYRGLLERQPGKQGNDEHMHCTIPPIY
jgi:hypothetical protein